MPNTTCTAPVGSIDMAVEGYVIWPCVECFPWHVEVVINDAGVFAREWHAVDCDAFRWLIATVDEDKRLLREKEAGQ